MANNVLKKDASGAYLQLAGLENIYETVVFGVITIAHTFIVVDSTTISRREVPAQDRPCKCSPGQVLHVCIPLN